MWARIHLIPLLTAEEDRDQVRRHYAERAREKELLGAEAPVYHSDRCVELAERQQKERKTRLIARQIRPAGVHRHAAAGQGLDGRVAARMEDAMGAVSPALGHYSTGIVEGLDARRGFPAGEGGGSDNLARWAAPLSLQEPARHACVRNQNGNQVEIRGLVLALQMLRKRHPTSAWTLAAQRPGGPQEAFLRVVGLWHLPQTQGLVTSPLLPPKPSNALRRDEAVAHDLAVRTE